MKNLTKVSFLVLLLAVSAGCSQKSTTNKKSSGATTNPSTNNPIDPNPTTPVTNCSDGVYRAGATSCYYSNIPPMVFSGAGTYGVTLWSSKTGLPNYISQNQFSTDSAFAVRIKPKYPNANESSKQGRTCSPYTNTNFTKLKVWVMLRRSTDTIGEVKELTANVNSYSNTARFTVPNGATEPFIMEVIGVNSDHRCNSVYGSLSASDKAACTAGTKYFDIPVNGTSNPTECVAFNIDFATDDTYDLPN